MHTTKKKHHGVPKNFSLPFAVDSAEGLKRQTSYRESKLETKFKPFSVCVITNTDKVCFRWKPNILNHRIFSNAKQQKNVAIAVS